MINNGWDMFFWPKSWFLGFVEIVVVLVLVVVDADVVVVVDVVCWLRLLLKANYFFASTQSNKNVHFNIPKRPGDKFRQISVSVVFGRIDFLNIELLK